jgi:hypothetical protein
VSLIGPQTLYDECDAFLRAYPWLWDLEASYHLPRGILLAVGSRETNLSLSWAENPHQPGNGGSGVWQQTFPPAPAEFPPQAQAETAAIDLQRLLSEYGGNVDEAADAYNSGRPFDAATTGGNYGSDVAARLALVQLHYPPPVPYTPPKESEMHAVVMPNGDIKVYAAGAGDRSGHLLEFTRSDVDQTNSVIDITAEIGTGDPYLVQP